MINFNKLEIKNNTIIIDVSVKDESYYKDIYIDGILIDTQDTCINSGPSEKAISVYKDQENLKNKHLELTSPVIQNVNSDLFFIYVKVKGTPSSDTPCGMDNSITGKALFNIQPIYKNIMNYVKELSNTCKVPYNLVDKSLQLKMLNICLQIGNNIEAADIWKKYFMDNITNEPINCNCNG